jgi:hypothetical protein
MSDSGRRYYELANVLQGKNRRLEKDLSNANKQNKKLRTALESIANYPPPDGRVDEDGYPSEVVYDQYAYRRMVDSYRECAKQVLTALGVSK